MEKCVGIPLMGKDVLKPPHTQAMLMFEDGNREVRKGRHDVKGRYGTRWELRHQGCSALRLVTVKTFMSVNIYQSHIPGKSWIAGPLKTLYWGL